MMSLWDALRMNMMISYQELVRTFQKANRKFERRFREVERIVAARGLEMTGVDLDTMEEVWQQVKRQETDL
ncbi:hypothetical protein NUKP74_27790 [Klebsiella quasipneumoniae]|nr:hypothetical protein NUKP74_27790 [Klebsiella quasipneumoniae]